MDFGMVRRSIVRLALTGLPSSRSPRLLFIAVEWGIRDIYCEKIKSVQSRQLLDYISME